MSDCASRKEVKARKAHRCRECGVWIAPGNAYAYHSGIYDAAPYHFRVCLACDALGTWANSKGGPLHDVDPEDQSHNLLHSLLECDVLTREGGSVTVAADWDGVLEMDPARQYPRLKLMPPRARD